MSLIRVVGTVLMLGLPLAGWSQSMDAIKPHEEYSRRLRAAEMVEPLSSELFGDQVSLFNGATQFAVTDIELPGTGPRVALSRVLRIESKRVDQGRLGGFGNWDVDVPHMKGTFDRGYPWKVGVPSFSTDQRCSVPAPVTVSDVALDPRMVAAGITVHIPGLATEEPLRLASEDSQRPSSDYAWGTRSHIKLRCLPQLRQSGGTADVSVTGEGFEAIDTQGTRYRFDVAIAHEAPSVKLPPLESGGGELALARVNVYLLASEVVDRFNNKVNYYYSSDGSLERIVASDGRKIEVASRNRGHIATVNAGGRTWSYTYLPGPPQLVQADFLESVVLPDLSRWSFSQVGSLYLPPPPNNNGGICSPEPTVADNYELRITHPAGAVGQFEFAMTPLWRRFRPNYDNSCSANAPHPYALFTESFALTRKSIDNRVDPAATDVWAFGNGPVDDAAAESLCPGCGPLRVADISQPDGSVRQHFFGDELGTNEGRLMLVRTLSPAGEALSSEFTKYAWSMAPGAFLPPAPYAQTFGTFGTSDDPLAYYRNPVVGRVITRQGTDYVRRMEVDAYERPERVRKYSGAASTGPGGPTQFPEPAGGAQVLDEAITYKDFKPAWVMGQVERVVVGGNLVRVEREFDPVSKQPRTLKQFGRLLQAYDYWPSGELKSVEDAAGASIELRDYKRGIPQEIALPLLEGQAVSDRDLIKATVDDWGQIRSVTNPMGEGYTTSYDYDSLGRIRSVTHPNDPTQGAWAVKQFEYLRIPSGASPSPEWNSYGSSYGLPAGLLVRVVKEGSRRSLTYFDGRMRPLVTRSFRLDGGVRSEERVVLRRFDAENRERFVSRAVSQLTSLTQELAGLQSTFDALGRITERRQDTELGQASGTPQDAVWSILYGHDEDGPYTLEHNPRQVATKTRFQAFDDPSSALPRSIEGALGVLTLIERDVFGKPVSITRSGPAVGGAVATQSLSRQLVYAPDQQLCKRIDPESGATLFRYDSVGNLTGVAEGQSLLQLACDRSSVSPQDWITSTFDSQGRVTSVSYPDGVGNQLFEYTKDGLIEWASAGGVITGYEYNRRRLLTGEVTMRGGLEHRVGYTYDALGQPSGIQYPDGSFVSSSPNVHGEPTRAGAYVHSAQYDANAFLTGFIYGNGVAFSATPNVRGMPDTWSYAGPGLGAPRLYGLETVYDFNGNLTDLVDLSTTTRSLRSRHMVYDDRDRLEVATASGLWGVESFSYDALDNIHTHTVGGAMNTHVLDARNRLAAIVQGRTELASFQYDAKGRLGARSGQSVYFSADGRLRGVGLLSGYLYDHRGFRLKAPTSEKGATTSRDFVYGQGGVLLAEVVPSEGAYTNHMYLGRRLVAKDRKPLPSLSAPSLTVPAQTGPNFTVAWGGISGALRYELQEQAGNGPWASTVTAETSVAQAAKPVGNYRYRVRACGSMHCSAYSADAVVAVSAAVLGIPQFSGQPVGLNGSVMLNWSAVATAVRYELQRRTASTAWQTVANGGALSASLTGLAAGAHQFQVRACSSATVCGAWSTVLNVDVVYAPTAVPVLTAPPSSTNGNFGLSWTASATATRYELERSSASAAFSALYSGPDRAYSESALPQGSYSYRVRACNVAGCSGYSATASVAVGDVPAISAPASSYSGQYTLSWTAVAGSSRYELQEQIGAGSFGPLQNSSQLTHTTPGRAPGTYTYRVRACSNTSCGAYSSAVSVSVLTLGQASLSGPASTSVPLFDLSWSPVTGAAQYRLESAAPGSSWITEYVGAMRTATVAASTNGTHRYRVRACAGSNCGSDSAVLNVFVDIPPPPPAPTHFVFAAGSGGATCVFNWNGSAGASTYQLEQVPGGQIYAGAATFFTWDAACAQAYRVRACNAQACSDWVGYDLPPPLQAPTEAPALSVPASSGTGNYSVTWQTVARAGWYELEEQANGNGWAPVSGINTLSKDYFGRADGSYAYRVRGCNSSGCGPHSLTGSITVQRPVGTPVLSAPSNSANGSYTVSWTPAANAATYHLREQRNQEPATDFAGVADLSRAFSGKPGGAYFYAVRACSASGACGDWSNGVTVTVAGSLPPPPVPTGLQVTAMGGSCRIQWNASSGASHYALEDNFGNAYESSSTQFLWDAECAPAYRVSACHAEGCSAWSGYVGPTGIAAMPAKGNKEVSP